MPSVARPRGFWLNPAPPSLAGRESPLRAVPAKLRGFTLLEIVVVILIIGVMVTFASLSIGNRALEDKLETEARRTEAIIRLAAEEAEAKGIEIGLRFSEGGYRLLVLNDKQRWTDLAESGSLRQRELGSPMQWTLRVEDRPIKLPLDSAEGGDTAALETADRDDNEDERSSASRSGKRKLEPQVYLLSSGEMTPFSLEISAPGLPQSYLLKSDAMGRLKLERVAAERG